MLLSTVNVLNNTRYGDDTSGSLSFEKAVSLYVDPPSEEITLDEFELYALDRLQLLRGIEALKTRGFKDDEYANKVKQLESKYMPLKSNSQHIPLDANGRTPQMRKDQVSHYILRLAYCRTEDLRRWFLAHECHLLKYRVDSMSTTARANFMHTHGLADDKLTSEEKEARRHKLIGLAGITELNFASNEFYKVPFQQALSLLAHRQVYIEKGYAFLPIGKLVATVVSRFRILLSRALIEASQMFDHVSGDTRIGPLLKNMNKQYIGKDFSKSAGSGVDKLTPDIIDDAAENNMPLCMKNLHQNLKKEHKLKHWGRLQYGLFLKGAGMELEDAMVFWESHFTRLLSHDNFQKQYAYSFRHMYGKEGARKNYTPYSCMKIIMGAAPEAGAYHGCPYRHSTDQQLVAQLNGMKLSSPDVNDIMKLAKSSNYQLACQKHFDVTHPDHLKMDLGVGEGGAVSNHPNMWYQTSVKYHRAKAGVKAGTTPATGGGAKASGDRMDVESNVEDGSASVSMEVA